MRRQSSVVSKSIPVGKRQDTLTQAKLSEWLQNVFDFLCRYHNRINHQWKQIHTSTHCLFVVTAMPSGLHANLPGLLSVFLLTKLCGMKRADDW